ncbi:MAG: hypothetical protein R3E32_25485 [Chitinophagales bacterium]
MEHPDTIVDNFQFWQQLSEIQENRSSPTRSKRCQTFQVLASFPLP